MVDYVARFFYVCIRINIPEIHMNIIRESILEAMFRQKGECISGAYLGSLFGISRASVWKHISLLL